MADQNDLKIADILDEFYTNQDTDKGVDILTEVDDNSNKKKCFKEVLKEKGKSIPQMTEKEKKEFFSEIKKRC